MSQDKQLSGVRLEDVLRKRQIDQALNAKEFAVLAGVSYSAARNWFRRPGFPVVCGVVFWDDFVKWRHTQGGLGDARTCVPWKDEGAGQATEVDDVSGLPPRGRRLLAEAGY
jgi:hypothetical protein